MAQGENAARQCGKEYWKSRLHRGGELLGRYTKFLTHKKERRDARRYTKLYLVSSDHGDTT
jgi:hypothetical protein